MDGLAKTFSCSSSDEVNDDEPTDDEEIEESSLSANLSSTDVNIVSSITGIKSYKSFTCLHRDSNVRETWCDRPEQCTDVTGRQTIPLTSTDHCLVTLYTFCGLY